MATTSSRVAGLDGLRAIAILLVIAWHARSVTRTPEAALGWARGIVYAGWAGVDLFFALSGFLITSLILREESTEQARSGRRSFSLPAFYLRRALRILPVFYLVIALNRWILPHLGASSSLPEGGRPGDLDVLPFATFWSNYYLLYGRAFGFHPGHVGNAWSVQWSLCVEEHFYLLWPLFLCLVKRTRVRIAVGLAVCVLAATARTLTVARGLDPRQAIHIATHYRLDGILWGGLAALVALERNGWQRRLRRALLFVLGPALIALIASRELSVLPPATALGAGVGFSMLAVVSAALVAEVAGTPRSRLVSALSFRPLAFVGVLSYAMYLIHFQVMDFGQRMLDTDTLGFAASLVFFTAITIGAAWPLHAAVERPFLRLKERLRPPRRSVVAGTVADQPERAAG